MHKRVTGCTLDAATPASEDCASISSTKVVDHINRGFGMRHGRSQHFQFKKDVLKQGNSHVIGQISASASIDHPLSKIKA